MLPVTSLMAGLAIVMLIALSANVVRLRWKTQVSILDGGNDVLAHAIRAHGNFVEYTPFMLLGLGILELQGASAMLLLVLGGVFLVCRASHATSLLLGGVKRVTLAFRGIGMLGTFSVLGILAAMLVF